MFVGIASNIRRNYLKKDCASVFFTDADSLFLTDDDPIKEWVIGEADFVYAGDHNWMMNAGQFWIRSTKWGRDFINRVWKEYPKRDETCTGNDNAAFNSVLSGKQCWWAHINSKKCVRESPLVPHVRCLDQNTINAYAPPPHESWRLHTPGSQARKYALLKKYA